MIKLILFDYDGVIVDSFRTVYEVYQVMCQKLGKRIPSFEEFKILYTGSYWELYKKLGITADETEQASRIFGEEILKKEPPLFDGIREVLQELSQKYVLVVISATYTSEVMQKLKKFDLLSYFKDVKGQENASHKMRKVEAIREMMKKYGVTEEETLFIGDRGVDYEVGIEAGLSNILLVEYGWGYDVPDYKPKCVVKEPGDLLTAIKKF